MKGEALNRETASWATLNLLIFYHKIQTLSIALHTYFTEAGNLTGINPGSVKGYFSVITMGKKTKVGFTPTFVSL